MRELDAPPIVTYDSVNPDTLSIALFADSERFDFKMDVEKAERLRYLLGRALDSRERAAAISILEKSALSFLLDVPFPVHDFVGDSRQHSVRDAVALDDFGFGEARLRADNFQLAHVLLFAS